MISGCYHRINAETLIKPAVSAKAVSAPKTWCGHTTQSRAQTLLARRSSVVSHRLQYFLRCDVGREDLAPVGVARHYL